MRTKTTLLLSISIGKPVAKKLGKLTEDFWVMKNNFNSSKTYHIFGYSARGTSASPVWDGNDENLYSSKIHHFSYGARATSATSVCD